MSTKKVADAIEEVDMSAMPFYVRLHKAKQLIGKVHKNAINPHFKKNYADINSILDTVEPILLQHDLLLLQPIKDNVVVSQIIDIHSGDLVESYMTLLAITDPQKVLSAVTYFRRGTLQSLLSLQAVDDDGSTAASSKPSIDNKRFEEAVQAINDNKYTVAKLKASFELTDLQTKALLLL